MIIRLNRFRQKIKEHRIEKKELTDSLLGIMKENEIDCFDINNGKIFIL